MKPTRYITCLIFILSFAACNDATKESSEMEKAVPSTTQVKTESSKSMIAIFEIPATEITRAVQFYQAILDIKIEQMEMPGMKMGIFPSNGQAPFGVISEADGYQPSANGVTIYLDAGENLSPVLSKVEDNGGNIVVPKTQHADESGYFAIFLDSEGNKIGLHSIN